MKKLIAILSLGLMVYINMTSVKLYVKVQNIFGVFKIAACVLVIIGGSYWLAIGNTERLHDPFKNSDWSPGWFFRLYCLEWKYDFFGIELN